MLVVLEELYKTFRAVVKLLTLFVPVRVVSTMTLRTVSLRRGSIVAKAETVYLPVRTKCVTFVTTPPRGGCCCVCNKDNMAACCVRSVR